MINENRYRYLIGILEDGNNIIKAETKTKIKVKKFRSKTHTYKHMIIIIWSIE